MIVPAAVQQAEDFAAPPSEPPASDFGPPPSAGGESWLDDLAGASQAPDNSAAAPGDEERRPCPECGEMIIARAVKCRFCGAIFDPRLRRAAGRGRPQSQNGFAITSMVLGIVGIFTGCIGIVFGITATVFGFVALNGMKRSGNREGRGMAVTGIVLGIIDAVGWTIVYIVIFTVAANMHNFPPPRFR
jgi:hypothetical protein